MACFFYALPVSGQSQIATNNTYESALALQFDIKKDNIENDETLYYSHLAQVIEILAEEDPEKTKTYLNAFQALQNKWDSKETAQAYLADLQLLWAFARLKSKQEFQAALLIKKAYRLVHKKELAKNFNALKTRGVLLVMLGAVPEKYSWLLGLFSLKGNTQEGLKLLSNLHKQQHQQAWEAGLWLALVNGFLLQQPDIGIAITDTLAKQKPDRKIALLLGASLALKSNKAEIALQNLQQFQTLTNPPPLVFYLAGEANICKGYYVQAASYFILFTQKFKGTNLLKDASFKTGLAYTFLNQPILAKRYFLQAQTIGTNHTEADKHAEKAIADYTDINKKLWQMRLFTDGGYYAQAQNIIDSLSISDFKTKKDKTEFLYRTARIFDKTKQTTKAKNFYLKTIELAANENWYFAPNSCLQIGYMCMQENKPNDACIWFKRALTYNHHEYKNSIDAKAKSAMHQAGCK